jgi:hypothetical protein
MVPSSSPKADQAAPKAKQIFGDEFYQDPYGLDRYVVQEKALFEWRSPSKIDRKRTRSDFFQIILFFVIIGLIIVLLGEMLLFLVFLAGAFLYLVTIVTRPTFLQAHITTLGIKVEDKYYFWPQIPQFWFESRLDTRVLVFRHFGPNMKNVRLAVQSSDEETITTILGKYILCKRPTLTNVQIGIETLTQAILSLFDSV